MQLPIEIPARARESHWPVYVTMVVAFGAPTLLLIIFWKQQDRMGIWVFALLIGGLILMGAFASAIGAFTQRKLKGLGAVVTDEGIGKTRDGENEWLLPWSEFGGYRIVKVSDWQRSWNPEGDGVEILNVAGESVGILQIHPGGFIGGNTYKQMGRAAKHAFFWQEVDHHVPEGGPKYIRPVVSPVTTTSKKVKRQFFLAITLTGLGAWLTSTVLHAIRVASDESVSPLWLSPWMLLLAACVLIAGLTYCITACFSLWILKRPQKLNQEANPVDEKPADGPSYNEFLATHEGLPKFTALNEGVRYVQVDPEARRAKLKTGIWAGIAGVILFGGVFLPGAISSLTMALAFGPFYIPIIYFYFLFYRMSAQEMKTLDDVIVPLQGGMVVIKKDGTRLHFSSRAERFDASWLTRKMLGPQEVWRENGLKYQMDKGHLIASDIQLRPEELRSLEQEFQR